MGQSVSAKRSRKWPTLGSDLEESAQELAGLPALDLPALRQRWATLFGDDPSPNLGRGLLLRAIAYRLQEKASPGLKPATRRVLDRIADNRSSDAPQSVPQSRASAGTVLIREWRERQSSGRRPRQPMSFTAAGVTSRSRRWPARSPARAGRGRCSSV